MSDEETARVVRGDGSEVSPQYLAAVRSEARGEARAAVADRPTTLSAAFGACREDDAPS